MKVAVCTKDPYCYLESRNTVSGCVEWSEWSKVILMFADIYNYLVVTISLYTCEQLIAYNFSINRWVNIVTVLPIGKRIICF